jgi:hypothetical protein
VSTVRDIDQDASTRVEGAERSVILITAKATLAAGAACLCLTVIQESGELWRYNLSAPKNSRLAHGKIIVPATWPSCAGPLRSARTGTSPAASSAACSAHSPRTRHDMRPPLIPASSGPFTTSGRRGAGQSAASQSASRSAARSRTSVDGRISGLGGCKIASLREAVQLGKAGPRSS